METPDVDKDASATNAHVRPAPSSVREQGPPMQRCRRVRNAPANSVWVRILASIAPPPSVPSVSDLSPCT